MPPTIRPFVAPVRLLRLTRAFNGSQGGHVDRQWHRHLSLQALNLHRPTPPLRTYFPSPRRYQSTAASIGSSILVWIYGTGLVLLLGFGYLYITDTRASIHQWLIVPALRVFHADPEEAHHAGIRYIKGLYNFNLHPRERGNHDQKLGDLRVEVFGHILDNPIGTSAGIDKNAEIPSPLLALGPGIVEVGGATPYPQDGNAKPRVFRIPSQNALINRYGLNSEGVEHVAMQLRERLRQFAFDNGLGLDPESERIVLDGEAEVPPGSLVPGKLLAVQIAKNKTTPDNDIEAVARDYVTCVDHLAKYADILVVNVSSPNTPGLRNLQATAPLTAILSAVVDATKNNVDRKTPPAVMVKVSPDEDSDAQIEGICSAVWNSGVDGVIVGNTTKKRPDPLPRGYIMPAREERLLTEAGGYSGPQMFERTLELVRRYRVKLDQGPPVDADVDERPAKRERESSVAGRAQAPPQSTSSTPDPDPVDTSVQRDRQRLKPHTSESEKQSEESEGQEPLIQLPERHNLLKTFTSSTSEPATARKSASETPSSLTHEQPKVIFATGGITNGQQCLQILNAGASVCQIYTAMMYGGVGTVTRMKAEMRQSIQNNKPESR